MSAFSSTPDDFLTKQHQNKESEFMQNPNVKFGLESMLQESMYYGQKLENRWSTGIDVSTMSTDFQPCMAKRKNPGDVSIR